MEAPLLLSERILSIKYEKAKQNVIKRSKIPFSGLWVLLTGLWDLKDILISRQNRSKNNWWAKTR